MIQCRDCKYSYMNVEGELFCDIQLPTWLLARFPNHEEFHFQVVTPSDGCDLGTT